MSIRLLTGDCRDMLLTGDCRDVLPEGFSYATSAELFEALGSPDPGRDARAVEAIVRRNRMHVIPEAAE